MGLWAKSVVIFNSIREHGKQSIRSLAQRTGLSKSSVHRHLQAMDRRDRYSESSFWETEAGRAWLIRLVVATLFVFGLKRGVGAETLSEFFSRLRLDGHIGCSPSALRSIMHILERHILDTTAAWEQDGIAHGEVRPIIGAVDETFLQRMMRVFMDLVTGYLLMEEIASDRSYETWFERANARLQTFGVEVSHLVSDRAKALIKLAQKGFGCLSIPDLFHVSHDLAKGYSLSIFSRLRQAKRELDQAKQRLETLQKHTQADSTQITEGEARVAACAASVHHWQEASNAWRQHVSNLSRIVHPWRLSDSMRQSSKDVEEQLQGELKAVETFLESHGLPVKQETLRKVQKQFGGISALIDWWWRTMRQDLALLAMTPRWSQWAQEVLLPLMHWQEQLRRTRHPAQKAQIALVIKALVNVIRAPVSFNRSCWRLGNRGRWIMPKPSSERHRRSRDATATSRRCSIIIAAYQRVAMRCGRRCTTSIVALQMGRRQRRGFSGGRFPICLRVCCHRLTSCPCPGSAVKPCKYSVNPC
jgi:IclR helix-turn-helix domain